MRLAILFGLTIDIRTAVRISKPAIRPNSKAASFPHSIKLAHNVRPSATRLKHKNPIAPGGAPRIGSELIDKLLLAPGWGAKVVLTSPKGAESESPRLPRRPSGPPWGLVSKRFYNLNEVAVIPPRVRFDPCGVVRSWDALPWVCTHG